MAEDISTEELLRLLLEQQAREMRIALPGRIESYDASKQRASVRLELQYYLPDPDGNPVPQDHPVLQNVPVEFPQGGGFFCSFPLAKDDYVQVLFCDVPIGAWLQKGGKCEPGHTEMHGMGGAVVLPLGPRPTGKALQSADGTNMRLGKDGTDSAQIEITGTEIHLGAGASKGVARNGDGCDGGTLVFFPGTGGATLSYIPPGGVVTPPTPPTINIPLAPKINAGSSKVKAED